MHSLTVILCLALAILVDGADLAAWMAWHLIDAAPVEVARCWLMRTPRSPGARSKPRRYRLQSDGATG
jgi:hypothetical protein